MDPKTGKANLELMQAGRAPIGPDGNPINLHHMTQTQDGPIAELTQTSIKATPRLFMSIPTIFRRVSIGRNLMLGGGHRGRTMADDIDAIIDEVNRWDDPAQRKNSLPDDALIARYEAATGFRFTEDYKKFLKTVSIAFVGYLSPLTLNEEMGGVYGELRSAIGEGQAIGFPRKAVREKIAISMVY
ncbi:HNH/ENDO VII family nuclease [Rhizobium sp. 2YAF20]|uniref:HNH/ENDO VII family nuclease n=1 Tax=Rhizobium sp. 2YAF20 TaxID=3233027 RepID=UPI003F95EFF5